MHAESHRHCNNLSLDNFFVGSLYQSLPCVFCIEAPQQSLAFWILYIITVTVPRLIALIVESFCNGLLLLRFFVQESLQQNRFFVLEFVSMPRIFGTRFLSWIVKRMSKSSKKKSDEAADEALALQLQDEELARELQFHELSLDFSQEFDPEFDDLLMFDESLNFQGSSSVSASNSKTPYPGSMACTEPDADFLRALGINLPPLILEKECGICFDTLPQSSFVSTPGCAHEYCTDCCQNHAEAKIMSGSSQIKCPEGTCVHHYDVQQCRQLLSDSSFDALNVRLTEAAIPAALKVFCPFVDCSAFMEKSATTDIAVEPFAECYACHRGFCQECNVPWHAHQTCGERRADELNSKLSGDSKLRDLARQEKWQQCPDCNRMIDLIRGCNHMTCLCGLEFCYVCRAKWKDKAATCKCNLWDETRIIHS